MLVVILVKRNLAGEYLKTKILRAQPFPQFFVRKQINESLPAPLDCQIGLIVGVESITFMVEYITLINRWPPVHDPAFFRPEPVIRRLVEFPNIHAIHEPRNRDETGADIVINALIRKVQSLALQIELFRRARVMIFVPGIA